MVVLQNFRFPEDYCDDIKEIMSLSNKQYEVLERAISLLFTRIGDLFKDHSILDVIRDYESQIDVFERKLYEKSYSLDLGLAERMQLTEFVSSLCDLSDIAENVADKIQIMIVTRKA
jgi:predicted phosphate transport protein (TIGR00153 family)